MSGRYPMRLGHYTDNTAEWDLDRAKLLPAVLKAGRGDLQWATHALGKWHVGWYYKNFTPTMRGFDTFYGSSGNTHDYWMHTLPGSSTHPRCGIAHTFPKDFIDAKGSQLNLVDPSAFGKYDAELLSARAMRIVSEHDLDKGLYVYLAFHNVHDPQMVPLASVERYTHTCDDGRKVSNAMLTELDNGVANVTAIIRARGMWNATLVSVAPSTRRPPSCSLAHARARCPQR